MCVFGLLICIKTVPGICAAQVLLAPKSAQESDRRCEPKKNHDCNHFFVHNFLAKNIRFANANPKRSQEKCDFFVRKNPVRSCTGRVRRHKHVVWAGGCLSGEGSLNFLPN